MSVVSARDVGNATIREICTLKAQHWPHSMDSQIEWWHRHGGPDDLLVCLRDGHDLVAFLRLRYRRVLSGPNEIDSLCATEVCVARSVQGEGWGRKLMDAASATIKEAKKPLGYLLCREAQRGFYEKCGWVCPPHPFIIRDSGGCDRMPSSDEHCFVFDPTNVLIKPFVLVGDVF